MYNNYPKTIQRVDTVRYFILYKYGGIYADMDYVVKKNFFNELEKEKINIIESNIYLMKHYKISVNSKINKDIHFFKVM